MITAWLNRSEEWHTYHSAVQDSVPHLLQPLTAVTMPEGGIADRNQRHLWTKQNCIQFYSQLAHRTCRDFHLHAQLRNNRRVKQLTCIILSLCTPETLVLFSDPNYPSMVLLQVPKEGLVALAINYTAKYDFLF